MTIAAANWWRISILIGNPHLTIVKHHYINVYTFEGESNYCKVADGTLEYAFPKA
jgi:hypothetical protein